MYIDNLVNESYEYLIEYQQEMHDLDMKMIKCEHHCIINEDSNMMMLAEEEYKNNVQAALKTIWNKVVITIQNFIITINKTINKFRMRFKVSNSLKHSIDELIRLNRQGNYITYDNAIDKDGHFYSLKKEIYMNVDTLIDPNGFTKKLDESINELKKLKNNGFDNQKAKKILNDLKFYDTGKEIADNDKNKLKQGTWLKTDLVINAYTIITDHGPKWIKSLENAKNEAKIRLKNIFDDAKSTTEATYFQRIINSCIFAIQKVITSCFKICYDVEHIQMTVNYTKIDDAKYLVRKEEKIKQLINITKKLYKFDHDLAFFKNGIKNSEKSNEPILNCIDTINNISNELYEKFKIFLNKINNMDTSYINFQFEIQKIISDVLSKNKIRNNKHGIDTEYLLGNIKDIDSYIEKNLEVFINRLYNIINDCEDI